MLYGSQWPTVKKFWGGPDDGRSLFNKSWSIARQCTAARLVVAHMKMARRTNSSGHSMEEPPTSSTIPPSDDFGSSFIQQLRVCGWSYRQSRNRPKKEKKNGNSRLRDKGKRDAVHRRVMTGRISWYPLYNGCQCFLFLREKNQHINQ